MLATKGMSFPLDVILVCIRWYAAYPLSYRHLEEMMKERGVFVDHSSINRWATRFLPSLEKLFRKYKRPVGGSESRRMDETYIKVKGVWKYFYRPVDKEGKTVDVLLTAKRDKAAAMRFFDKAMQINGIPEKVTMDKSGANKPAMDAINASSEIPIIVRQVKYLNNIVEQGHRAVTCVTKPMLNFKSFQSAKCIVAGIELMHMIRKGQFMMQGCFSAFALNMMTNLGMPVSVRFYKTAENWVVLANFRFIKKRHGDARCETVARSGKHSIGEMRWSSHTNSAATPIASSPS